MDIPGPASRIWFSQRLRLHYVDWGNPAAPPLILLHGGRDHCRSWDWLASTLRPEWHVIAPDLRGHGDSAWSLSGTYSMANYIYDLAQLVHQQKLAPVSIVAHSLGGNIALRYSGIYPEAVRRLVAIEGLGPGPRSAAARDAKPIDQRMRAWVEEQRAQAAHAAALCLIGRRLDTHATSQHPPHARAGAAPDATCGESERGWDV